MPSNAVIEVRGLTFAYSGGPTVLRDVSFKLGEGEKLGVVGPNGAGKSTLFLCLAGVLPVKAGMIQVAGLDPAKATDKRLLPSKVGIIFPNSDDQLFCTTVQDDVAFGPLNMGYSPPEVRQRVQDALRKVGAEGLEQRVPQHLSSGEKRRIALAGVLAMQPDILLLDEPSLYLDPRGRRELIELLVALPASRMIASHDLEMILRTCEGVLLLDQGGIVAQGNSAEVLADTSLMAAHGLEVPWSLRQQR